MSLRLDQLQNKKERITRTFAYPPLARKADQFLISASFVSPAVFNEAGEKLKVKYVGGKRRKDADLPTQVELREAIGEEVFVKTIEKVEGLTIGKLRDIIHMSAESVAAAGGLETPVPADPKTEEGKANLLFLMKYSPEFFEWLSDATTDLSNFQDEEWEERAGNSSGGPATNTAAA